MPGQTRRRSFQLTTTFTRRRSAQPGRVRGGRLRHPGRTTARSQVLQLPGNHDDPGPGPGAEHWSRRPGRQAADHAPHGSGSSNVELRQPADAARRRRSALRRAGLRRRPAARPVPAAAEGAGRRSATKVAFEDTLGEALATLFGTGTGTVKPPRSTGPTKPADGHRPAAARARPSPRRQAAFTAGEQALAKGDCAAYGAAQDRGSSKALAKATAAEREIAKGSGASPRRRPSPPAAPPRRRGRT